MAGNLKVVQNKRIFLENISKTTIIYRWIKFEETVEVGGNRWSKPHVGSLSLHYVFELRKMLQNCTIFLDLPAKGLVK
jgi:hypothetical protein